MAKGNAKYVPQKTSNTMTYLLGGAAVLVIAVIVVVGVVWNSNRTETRNEGYGTVRNAPVAVQQDGVALLGKPDAPHVIDVYEDPLCPVCRLFERQYGQEIAQLVDEGKVAVRYRMLNFLNRASHSGDYSTRAVAALRCVADTGDGKAYSSFHHALFDEANQPAENGDSDLSNAQLGELAKTAGAAEAAVQCITSGAAAGQAAQDATAGLAALKAVGGQGTPSVYDGTSQVNTQNPNWLNAYK